MNTRKPVVLVAPLDWGLGHTVRCIPIIKELLVHDCEVLVACNSKQKQQLAQEFSSLAYLDLQGYDMYYGKSRLLTILTILFQAPKILTRIKQEQAWLSSYVKQNQLDAIVSDNRYGLFAAQIPCVFITHQLHVRSGLGTLTDNFIRKRLYRYINKFKACWVPDWKNTDFSVAGDLSHPQKLPAIPVNYIGCLSRLSKCVDRSKTTGILIILSGPEPQRTALEDIMMEELRDFKGSGLLIRGILNDGPVASFNKITVLNYVSSTRLNTLICNADVVVCRAGYTSVMDILKLGKKAVLIPTPGQAEQEYLASRLHRQKRAIMVTQKKFRLNAALQALTAQETEMIPRPMDDYKKVVGDFCQLLKLNSGG
jgi:uncharacterized protein (TIGR00661 family)